MNNVSLVGRMTRDVEIRYSADQKAVVKFTVAVDRQFKSEGGQSADFISCTAFGKTAEFIGKYFSKGSRIGLTGRIQTGSYKNKDGGTVYTTDVVANNVEFVESKGAKSSEPSPQTRLEAPDEFVVVPDDFNELPFN